MANLSSRVHEIIEQRNHRLSEELSARRAEIFSRFPRIKEIEKKFDATGMNLMTCVAGGSCEPEEAVRKIMAENRAANEEKKAILTENGYDADYIEPRVFCGICNDTGYVGGEICSCVKTELNKQLLSEANLSEKLSGQTFEGFRFDLYSDENDPNFGVSPRDNIKSVFRLCRGYSENFRRTDKNLFFTGGSGLGKTYLSSAIANRLVSEGVDVLYISANSLFPILENLHFNREVSESERYLVTHSTDCELLILDDLGAEFSTQFTSAELFRIINDRLMNNRKMIISTNLDFEELKKRYSERILSRIVGSFDIIAFFGDDIRRKMKMEGQLNDKI